MSGRDLVFIVMGALAGAVIDRLAGVIAGGGQRVYWLIRRALTKDHQTILAAASRNDHGGRGSIHINIACAPSHAWRSPRRISIDGADSWRAANFSDVFDQPDFATPSELVRYEVSERQHERVHLLNIRPNGLIEYSRPLDHKRDGDPITLSIIEIGLLIGAFVRSVSAGAYERSYQVRKEPKLDWFISITQSFYVQGKGSVPWRELKFPGRDPSPRPSEMHPPVFGPGLAEGRLRSLPARTGPLFIVELALTDLVERSGYRQFGAALEDSISELRGLFGGRGR